MSNLALWKMRILSTAFEQRAFAEAAEDIEAIVDGSVCRMIHVGTYLADAQGDLADLLPSLRGFGDCFVDKNGVEQWIDDPRATKDAEGRYTCLVALVYGPCPTKQLTQEESERHPFSKHVDEILEFHGLPAEGQDQPAQ